MAGVPAGAWEPGPKTLFTPGSSIGPAKNTPIFIHNLVGGGGPSRDWVGSRPRPRLHGLPGWIGAGRNFHRQIQ